MTVRHPATARFSLRRRLLAFLLVPLLLLMGGSVVSDYQEGLRVANSAYDYALFATAQAVAARLDPDPPSRRGSAVRGDSIDRIFYALIDSDGSFLTGDRRLLDYANVTGLDNPSYRFATLDDLPVRVATYRHRLDETTRPVVVVVAETIHKREIAATRAMLSTLWIDGALIVLSMIAVFFGVRYALKPLDLLGERIRQREVDDLRPVSEAGTPSETRALVTAINRLLDNLRDAGLAQQAFLSSAAHQLRTPLAGLQTQLELAAENMSGEPLQRMHAMHESARRLAHLTTQMLALARSSADANPTDEMPPVALNELLESAASDFIDAALAKNIDLGFEAEAAVVAGFRWMLRELLANLIDNSLRYTPGGGRVTVRCGTVPGGNPFIEIEDNGPGIPPDSRDRVLERFVRLDKQSGDGSGLGLSIVKEVAVRHRATLSLRDAAGRHGLLVRVEFPPCKDADAAPAPA
jgi:two-component system sensor histidine kinase TctE